MHKLILLFPCCSPPIPFIPLFHFSHCLFFSPFILSVKASRRNRVLFFWSERIFDFVLYFLSFMQKMKTKSFDSVRLKYNGKQAKQNFSQKNNPSARICSDEAVNYSLQQADVCHFQDDVKHPMSSESIQTPKNGPFICIQAFHAALCSSDFVSDCSIELPCFFQQTARWDSSCFSV